MPPISWSQEQYIKAFQFAAAAHLGQTVANGDLPYVTHVSLVSMEVIAALTVEDGRDGDLAVQCALLHDVIEDTAVTYEGVAQEFGAAVADGVLALSKDKRLPKDLTMPDSLRRICQQPREIWMVKLADRITNLQVPPPHWSSDDIRRYRDEAILILDALQDASDLLAARLRDKITAYRTFA